MVEKVSSAGTIFGSFLAIVSGLSLADWGVITGIVIGAVSLIFNKLHKMKMEKADTKFKEEMLNIARSKTAVTIIDVKSEATSD